MFPFPLHVPSAEVRATARCALPEIVGATVLTGPSPATVAVALLAWLALPSGLVAVTSTRTVAPTSAIASAYVAPVAPSMFCQLAPWSRERCHW